MKRRVLSALVLLACTKARTTEPPSGGSAAIAPAPAAPAMPTAPDSAAASSATPDAPTTRPTRPPNADVRGTVTRTPDRYDDDPEYVDVVAIPGGEVVSSGDSPGVALSKQISEITGRPGPPARALGPLVVVKSKTALDKTSLTAGRVVHEYVLRGQASVKRCFEALHAKDPSATGLLTLRFAVDVKGAVVDAHVEGFNSWVVSCVESALSTWTFTAPNKRTRFELVLNFVIG